MKLTKEIYLNCGIYNPSNSFVHYNDVLFIVVPGYFASDAWMISDNAYNDISGRKFEGITGDNNCSYLLERHNIRRINENDNIDELLNNCCVDFINTFKERFCKENDMMI